MSDNDADVLVALVAAFVNLRSEVKAEVEEKLLEQFRKQRSKDRASCSSGRDRPSLRKTRGKREGLPPRTSLLS